MKIKSRILFVLSFFALCSLNIRAFAEVTVEEVKQAVLQELAKDKPRTPADSPIFNPAMGVVTDFVIEDTKEGKGNMGLRSAELNFQSTVDGYAKLYAIIVGSDEGVEVEEAAVVTTALPYRLQLRGGRYFANFGRLPKFHDHELPFVNRTASMEYIGESKADGVELTHLFGTPFFLQGTFGVTNKIGAENTRLEDANGEGDSSGRNWNAFTYNARLFTYIPLADNHGLDLGVSEAYTPRQNYINGVYVSNTDPNSTDQNFSNNRRYFTGIDLTYRYEPLEKNTFRKFIWGTEVFNNQERRGFDLDEDGTSETFERRQAWGGYSYVDWRFAKKMSAGGFYDYAENLDDNKDITRSNGVFANFIPSEYQKIRLQYSTVKNNQPGAERDQQVYLQWIAIIGKHAHTFKDR